MALTSTSRPALRGRVLTRIPSSLRGADGIGVEKQNGRWTIFLDFSTLGLISSFDEPEDKQLIAYDPVTEDYWAISVQGLIDSLPEGDPGAPPGIRQNFDSSTTDADPGNGEFRLNHASPASATAAYLDNLDNSGDTVSSIIDTFDDSTNTIKGRLRFQAIEDITAWAEFNVTGSVVDGTGYRKVTLANGVAGSGTFTGDFAITFIPAGNVGPQGPATVPDRVARVATTANINLASDLENGDTIDGVTLATGDLVLVKNQSTGHQNGLYRVPASGAASRDDDFDTYDEHPGVLVAVTAGSTQADTLWLCTSNAGGTLNSTSITFAQFAGIASNSVAGLVKVSTSGTAAAGTATDEALRVADAAANFIGQGLHEIGHWPARALKPATTSGAATLATAESSTNKVNDEYLGFVNGSTTHAGFSFRAPSSLDEASGFTVEIEWMEAASATAHVCRWQVEMQAQGDADTIDAAWGTAVAVDDTGTSGTRRFAMTGTVTPAGSWAAGDKIHVRIARLGGHANDTLDVDARLIGVTLFATINAKNDA